MTADYWLERWREGRTAFHLADANPRLIEHSVVFSEASRVLVPLCGKSADLLPPRPCSRRCSRHRSWRCRRRTARRAPDRLCHHRTSGWCSCCG